MAGEVLIRRRDRSTTGGRATYPDGVCFVTGPHGWSIYSSTADPAKATRFDRAEAERLIARRWRGLSPEIVDPAEALS